MRKKLRIGIYLFIIILLCGCSNVIDDENNFEVAEEEIKQIDNIENNELSILGSYHEDMIKGLAEMFEEQTGCKIKYIRMPTGDAEIKLTSEKENPSCDVWIGGTVDAHEKLKSEGVLIPYVASNQYEIDSQYIDDDQVWKTQYVEVLSIGINMERWDREFANRIEKVPDSLEDLLNPLYKGEIIIPDPVTSGTGYTLLASILEQYGDEKGWEYIEKLNDQVGQYTTSGYTAAEKTGLGEYLICVNFLSDQLLVKSFGYSMDSKIYEGAGWTAVPVSLVNGAQDNMLAKQFIDLCLTKEACNMLVDLGNVLAVREDCNAPEGTEKLTKLEFNRAFDPIKTSKFKTERIDRFLELMP